MSLFDELNSLDDLQRKLVSPEVRESDVLEYKAASKRLESRNLAEIAKDMSAFANSVGGLVVYGITADVAEPTKPGGLEPIDPWNVNYLLHNAPMLIRHPIAGIRTKALPLTGTPEALLIDIPQSALAPHQVEGEYRYYRRDGVVSKPMSHDLVELYFGRRMHAKLEPALACHEATETPSERTCRVELGLINVGAQIGRDVLTRIVVPAHGVSLTAFATMVQSRAYPQRATPETQVFAYQHLGELYHPGVVRAFQSFMLRAPHRLPGSEQPAFFLDVYAADMRPYRYKLYLSVGSRGVLSLEWEDAGLPPVEV